MDELLAAIFGSILEAVAEALLEILLGLVAALLSRAIRRFFVTSHRFGRVATSLVFAVAGIAAGFLSTAAFPQPLVHPSRFHGVSLLISPLITGLAMAFIGRVAQKRGRKSVPIESFGYGFVFALAIAVVRFFLVK
jgi:hypothetical protein